MKKLNTEFTMTKAAVAKLVKEEGKSKSAKMKELFEAGMEIKEIAVVMEVRYNFVYNVVSNYITVNRIEVESNKAAGKKEAIIELFEAGKTNKEISAELATSYNYVYNTVRKYKAEHPERFTEQPVTVAEETATKPAARKASATKATTAAAKAPAKTTATK